MPGEQSIDIHSATQADLSAANLIIEACVMNWQLPERVKRLSLPSYLYDEHDLEHLEIKLAYLAEKLVGIAAWEPAEQADLPANKSGLLLHGLYVSPDRQNTGIGSQLLSTAFDAVKNNAVDGLLVKAQADANSFFQSRGFTLLPVIDEQRDYPHRWWKPVT